MYMTLQAQALNFRCHAAAPGVGMAVRMVFIEGAPPGARVS
jgi:hypothetical protein